LTLSRLELPTPKGQLDLSDEVVGDTLEQKEKAKKDAKRFRIVIAPLETGRLQSVCDRTCCRHSKLQNETY